LGGDPFPFGKHFLEMKGKRKRKPLSLFFLHRGVGGKGGKTCLRAGVGKKWGKGLSRRRHFLEFDEKKKKVGFSHLQRRRKKDKEGVAVDNKATCGEKISNRSLPAGQRRVGGDPFASGAPLKGGRKKEEEKEERPCVLNFDKTGRGKKKGKPKAADSATGEKLSPSLKKKDLRGEKGKKRGAR